MASSNTPSVLKVYCQLASGIAACAGADIMALERPCPYCLVSGFSGTMGHCDEIETTYTSCLSIADSPALKAFKPAIDAMGADKIFLSLLPVLKATTRAIVLPLDYGYPTRITDCIPFNPHQRFRVLLI